MKKFYSLFLSITMLLGLAVSGCSTNEQATKSTGKKQETVQKNVELTISAAASLQDALNDIKANFEKANPNVKINFNFGASGALQQQISQGAPVDLFFSAAEDKFNNLVQDDLIDKSQGKDVVGNELVLVVPKDTKKEINSFEDLTKADKISIGTPEAVPAGQYGKETLENLNVWKSIEGKVVYGKDVRQVLSYVETNNVDAGIVYKTDALKSTKVKIVATAAESTHDPIIYPLGVIKNSKQPKEAKKFYEYLQNDESMKILEKYGFKGLN
ncbi:molybdate ABC transporter substrate-binding protein [Bacillus sp. AFS077874]|uniref:molybdate ABC transporter substrate-binding protein n=1 Tax=unclassified Bacillus (in: firmicutes) TaxID=185979 RepID=UPI000BEC7272|nr:MULTISPECIES: molybdate ABC transporter substrate-binding protein [unclassified Bacillus (in: firmicutes)]PEC47984.1 molybdate ABC transporter substrate-binding protein [Bacillus sp. AFS096315]PFM83322.1 molybdate ABC transporter substrate-binding protein [Bacillus sp. AFS077874]